MDSVKNRSPKGGETLVVPRAIFLWIDYPNYRCKQQKVIFPKQNLKREDVDTMTLDELFKTNPPTDLVVIEDQKAVTTSMKIAEFFGKNHHNVLRDIKEKVLPHLPEDFTQLNFELSEYKDPTGRSLPMYTMTRDGFVLVVMGYTGEKAMQFKLEYIKAFNRMEAILKERADTTFDDEIVNRAAYRLSARMLPEFVKKAKTQFLKELKAQIGSSTLNATLQQTQDTPTEQTQYVFKPRPYTEWLPNMLTVDHIKIFLDINKDSAYNLMHRDDFPSIKVGGSLKVEKYLFFKWLDQQSRIPISKR